LRPDVFILGSITREPFITADTLLPVDVDLSSKEKKKSHENMTLQQHSGLNTIPNKY